MTEPTGSPLQVVNINTAFVFTGMTESTMLVFTATARVFGADSGRIE